MKSSKQNQLNGPIYSEASDWLIEFRSGDIDAAGRKEFCDWLRTSPEHMRAYLELAAIWNEGAALDQQRVFDDTALMAAIAQQDNNITSFPSRVTDSGRSEAGRGSRALPTAGVRVAAVAAGVLVALLGTLYWYVQVRSTYDTRIGEQRTLTLDDGSTVELDSDSRIRIVYSDRERQVELLDGQALFQVAHDPSRPFIVHTKTTDIRAVGTQFDVYKKNTGTTVTVVEGRVAVIPTSNPASSQEQEQAPAQTGSAGPPYTERALGTTRRENGLLLAAGEQVTVDAQGTLARNDQPIIATATAWTQRQLAFKGTSLHEVAEEFNRYNLRRLVINDPRLAELKITGIFSSTDPASLIRFLEARPDIVVTRTGNEILISRK
jgi:transmembrane sensor